MDYLSMDTTPYDEDGAGVGDMPGMRKDGRRMVELLHKRFPDILASDAPHDEQIYLQVRSNPHDFGDYLSLDIYYDDRSGLAIAMAGHIESNWPDKWTDTDAVPFDFDKAKREIHEGAMAE